MAEVARDAVKVVVLVVVVGGVRALVVQMKMKVVVKKDVLRIVVAVVQMWVEEKEVDV